MIQLPDISTYAKGGVIGILAFVIIGLIIVIGWLLKNGGSFGAKSPSPLQPRELTAGEKSTEYWERIFGDIETEGNRALLEVLSAQHRAVMEQLGRIRARLRDSDNAAALRAINELRAKYDQDSIAIAKMLRSLEQKLDDHR